VARERRDPDGRVGGQAVRDVAGKRHDVNAKPRFRRGDDGRQPAARVHRGQHERCRDVDPDRVDHGDQRRERDPGEHGPVDGLGGGVDGFDVQLGVGDDHHVLLDGGRDRHVGR
jgi:hypothetical protein